MKLLKNDTKAYFIGIVGTIFLILIDQYTKVLAVAHLKDQPSIDIWKNVFQLHYLENRGAAFGMFQGQKMFFIISGIIVLALFGYFYVKMPGTKRYIPLRICSVCIVAGAIGNMIDRITRDFVVDFFYFILIDFPIFNVADIYVTLSSFGLIALLFFYYREDELSFLTFKKI